MRARVPVRNLRLIALVFLIIITPFIYAAPASTNNTEAPSSISCTKQGNSDSSVCCRPSKWTDILIFYTTNYFAHAATTKTQPGQSAISSLLIVVTACLFPISGALRGVRTIESRAIFADTNLQTAARAGALCMVVKVPKAEMKGRSAVIRGLATKLHGHCKLPPGYFLMTVPKDVTFIEDEFASGGPQDSIWRRICSVKPQQKTSTSIPSSYNARKSLVAVLQAVSAIVTLYQSKGHQIDRFGYAAFGLTVVPYALMSVINLCANLFCPEYAAMYLVRNQALQNLQHRVEDTKDESSRQVVTPHDIGIAGQAGLGSVQADQSAEDQKQPDQAQKAHDDHEDQAFEISGTVGTLSLESDRVIQQDLDCQISSATYRDITDLRQLEFDSRKFISAFPSFLVTAVVVIAIVGGVSGFHKGSSTPAQRVWTMMWLSFGLGIGVIMNPAEMLEDRAVLNLGPMGAPSSGWERVKWVLSAVFFPIGLAVPAIGGLVVVAQMINSYGVCSVV